MTDIRVDPVRDAEAIEAGQKVVNLSDEDGCYEFLSRDEVAEIVNAVLASLPQPPEH